MQFAKRELFNASTFMTRQSDLSEKYTVLFPKKCIANSFRAGKKKLNLSLNRKKFNRDTCTLGRD